MDVIKYVEEKSLLLYSHFDKQGKMEWENGKIEPDSHEKEGLPKKTWG